MDTAATKARARAIVPRQLALSIPPETPRYWLGGDPYGTHLMNVLSLTFPAGERFFIDAVRAFRAEVKDPQLAAQVHGFVGQEALHSREHTGFNRWLARFGIDAEAFDRTISDDIARRRARRKPIDDLAVTCALEHFTAIMAEGWLTQDELRKAAAEPLRTLWTWHALEELDHKSVAFDVFNEVSGDYATRVRWMIRISIGFMLGVSFMHLRFMAADGQLKRPGYVLQRWWKYWGPRGHFTRLVPAYLRYYKRDFHPWDDDHTALIARFERVLRESGYAPSATAA
jgi:predicted metal-dependent hydrolase